MANGVRISNGVKLLKGIEAKVTELTFDSKVMVAVEQKTVKPPHWKEGEKIEYKVKYYKDTKTDVYSKKPAVYTIPESTDKKGIYVTVTVNVTKLERISGKATLLGNLGGLKMRGEFQLKKGETIVKVKIENPRKGIQWYKGAISWQLKIKGEPGANVLNGTFAEVFFILDKPADFYEKAQGVWAEALRFLCKRAVIINIKDAKAVTDRITRYCHGKKHGLKYDSKGGGGSKYEIGPGGGIFKLSRYLIRANIFANCYDQAGALQSLCGAVGVSLQWIYMDPFGFIKTADLLGYGLCNNPFFKMNNTKQIITGKDIDNPSVRTGFGNHAFCELKIEKIFDACAGPHTGDSRNKYVKTSVDSDAGPFAKQSAGTQNDMHKKFFLHPYLGKINITGVTGVS
jgi:hypothetical protein